MQSQNKPAYRPPVFVTGVMGGLQSMSVQPGFSPAQMVAVTPSQPAR